MHTFFLRCPDFSFTHKVQPDTSSPPPVAPFPPTICPSHAPHSETIRVCSSHSSSQTGSVRLLWRTTTQTRSALSFQNAVCTAEMGVRYPARTLLDKSTDDALGKHRKKDDTECLADELQLVYLPLRPPLCTATWCGGVSVHTVFCTACTMNSINVTS